LLRIWILLDEFVVSFEASPEGMPSCVKTHSSARKPQILELSFCFAATGVIRSFARRFPPRDDALVALASADRQWHAI